VIADTPTWLLGDPGVANRIAKWDPLTMGWCLVPPQQDQPSVAESWSTATIGKAVLEPVCGMPTGVADNKRRTQEPLAMKQHCQTNSLWDPGKDEDVSNAEQGTSTRHYVVGPTEVGWSSASRSKNRTSLPDSHHEQQAGPTTWTAKLPLLLVIETLFF
jgi:hypothetical protein